MTIFASDLDNTLIYSYKHDIGMRKRNVEIYQSREISFVTDRTHSLLEKVKEKSIFVPVTTRSIEQYKRIDFGIEKIKYALTCNGGVLLVDGEKDSDWYEESKRIAEQSLCELQKGISILEKDANRKFEIRFIENLFVFTKCENPSETVENLKSQLDCTLAEVFSNGEKIYILPKKLDKGSAVKRFKEKMNAKKIISAGDSEFDIPMLEASDIALIPSDFHWQLNDSSPRILKNDDKMIFSDFILENVLKALE